MTRRSFRVEIESGRRWRNEPLAVNLSRGFRRGPPFDTKHAEADATGAFRGFSRNTVLRILGDVKTLIYFSSYIINNGEGVLELESGHC